MHGAPVGGLGMLDHVLSVDLIVVPMFFISLAVASCETVLVACSTNPWGANGLILAPWRLGLVLGMVQLH